MRGYRIFALLLLAACCAAGIAEEPGRAPRPAIVTDAPGNVFFAGDRVELKMTAAIPRLAYTLLDWHGRTLRSGEWPREGAEPLGFDALANGYYIVRTTGGEGGAAPVFNFTVIPHPSTRKYPHDSFFGVDSAQSWLATPGSFQCRWYGGDGFRLVSDLIAWAGFPHVRERLSWSGVNPERGVFRYERYMRNAELLKERKILISGMFGDAPGWTDISRSIPRDLAGVFSSSRQFAHDFGDRMGDWEFWNEPDYIHCHAPVWDYTAAMKAACLGFRAGRPGIIAAPGALCEGVDTAYHHAMYLNDAAKYTDVMNYHTYALMLKYPKIGRKLRKFLADHGIPERAVWITESGTRTEGLSTEDGVMKGLKAHSPQQEMIHAEFYPKSQLYLWMQGIARNYFFVFPPYNEFEGRKDWGAMRRDGSVKPIYAAMSTMLHHLVDAKMLGEIGVGDGLKAFLLERPDGSQVLVFWQLSAIESHADPAADENFTVELADGDYPLVDMLGTPSVVRVRNGRAVLAASRYPAYLSGLRGLKADVKPFPMGKVDRHADQDANEDLAVIFRADLDETDFAVTKKKDAAEMKRAEGRMKVVIWNLNDTTRSGVVCAEGGDFAGIPTNVTIPPMGKVEFETVVRPHTADGASTGYIVLHGVFGGRKTTRLVIPVIRKK